jgi:hypothetical protein
VAWALAGSASEAVQFGLGPPVAASGPDGEALEACLTGLLEVGGDDGVAVAVDEPPRERFAGTQFEDGCARVVGTDRDEGGRRDLGPGDAGVAGEVPWVRQASQRSAGGWAAWAP